MDDLGVPRGISWYHPTFMNHVNLWPEMNMQSSSHGKKNWCQGFFLKETKFQAQVHLLRGETREVGVDTMNIQGLWKGGLNQTTLSWRNITTCFSLFAWGKACRKLEMPTSKPAAEVLRCRLQEYIQKRCRFQTIKLLIMKSWNCFPWKWWSNLHSIYNILPKRYQFFKGNLRLHHPGPTGPAARSRMRCARILPSDFTSTWRKCEAKMRWAKYMG